MAAPVQSDSDRRAGRGVWIGVIAGLTFVVLANAAMISVAVRNPPAHETDDHYGDAMRYDEVIEARAASEALGWTVRIEPCRGHLDDCAFTIDVEDADGLAVGGLEGDIELRRADDERFDRRAKVTALRSGRYTTDVSLGAAGLYEVAIELRGDAGRFTDKRRVVVGE